MAKKKRPSLAVQWLGPQVSAAGSMGSIPGWGTKIPHGVQNAAKKIKRKKKRERESERAHVFRRRKGGVRGDPWLYEEGAERVEMEQPIDRP